MGVQNTKRLGKPKQSSGSRTHPHTHTLAPTMPRPSRVASLPAPCVADFNVVACTTRRAGGAAGGVLATVAARGRIPHHYQLWGRRAPRPMQACRCFAYVMARPGWRHTSPRCCDRWSSTRSTCIRPPTIRRRCTYQVAPPCTGCATPFRPRNQPQRRVLQQSGGATTGFACA